MEVGGQDLEARRLGLARRVQVGRHISAVDRVASRGIPAVRPVEDLRFRVEVEVDRLGEVLEERLDVFAILGGGS